ncbi:hypothetical protein TKK_0012522 [Trichogramma kaykai]
MADPDDSLREFSPKSRAKFEEHTKNQKENQLNIKKYSEKELLKLSFSSDKAVEQFMRKYSLAVGQNFTRRDSKNKYELSNQNRVGANANLLFRSVKYQCYHGEDRGTSSRGHRKPHTSKFDCDSYIRFILTDAGDKYKFTEVFIDHSKHESLPNLRKLLPKNRIDKAGKEQVASTVAAGGRKLTSMHKLFKDNQRPIMRDVSNMQYAMRQKVPPDNLEAVKAILLSKNAVFEMKISDDNIFQALFFCTRDMQTTLAGWPEFIMMDGTYKLIKQNYPIIIIAVVDGNGATEIVGVAIVVKEDKDTVHWLLSTFQRLNKAASSRIECFMSDKDEVAREVVKELFGVHCFLCCFHVLQIFGCTITPDNFGITRDQKKPIIALLEKLRYSLSEQLYDVNYTEFCNEAPADVRKYYDDNWHKNRTDWVKCFFNLRSFCTETNNRVESLNQKIKLLLEKKSSMVTFLNEFFVFLDIHKNERDEKLVKTFLKKPAYKIFIRDLTDYAFEHVSKHIDAVGEVKYTRQLDSGYYEVRSSYGVIEYIASVTSCTCINFLSMGLPCKHIFKVRQICELDLFDPNLCITRWTRNYLRVHHQTFQETSLPEKQSTSQQSSASEFSKPKENNSQLLFSSTDSDPSEIVKLKQITSTPYTETNVNNCEIASINETTPKLPLVNSDVFASPQVTQADITSYVSTVSDHQIMITNVSNNESNYASSKGKSTEVSPSQVNNTEDVNIASAILPLLPTKRGRPKGSQRKACGLPKKNPTAIDNNSSKNITKKAKLEIVKVNKPSLTKNTKKTASETTKSSSTNIPRKTQKNSAASAQIDIRRSEKDATSLSNEVESIPSKFVNLEPSEQAEIIFDWIFSALAAIAFNLKI